MPRPDAEKTARSQLDHALSEMFKARMQKAFGTRDEDFISHLFEQTGNALPGGMSDECKNGHYFIAALHGIGPRDELEALLAVQMVSVHTLGMEFLKRAAISEQTDVGIEVNVNRANKLLRMFANQVEALSRYRGKGEQKMIVEHVHVYKGGQAIVGPVNQKSCGKRDQHDKIK